MAVITNKAESVLARLRNKAKQNNISYQHCLQLFLQEEFMRRLALSPYRQHLVLKGGLFIYVLTNFDSRATIDIDFLMKDISNREEDVSQMIQDIINTQTGNDYVSFSAKPLKPIALDKKYPGFSTQIIGKIKNVKVPFSVDMGVGDIITPSAQERRAFCMLNDFEAPQILTYSLESTIAEKFDAMLQRLTMNSRMKDFYDIYYLEKQFDFSGAVLLKAICNTLNSRGTVCTPALIQLVKELPDDASMQLKWGHFLRTLKQPSLDFRVVMSEIERFLHPVVEAMMEGRAFEARWSPEHGWH